MRPFQLFVLSSLASIAACGGVVVIDSSESSSAVSSSTGGGKIEIEEPTRPVPEDKPDASTKTCESFYCEWPVNECAGLESSICMSDQTLKVYECQQVKKDGCPEWVHVGDYVDGGVVMKDGG